jgi:hypothetical protein
MYFAFHSYKFHMEKEELGKIEHLDENQVHGILSKTFVV